MKGQDQEKTYIVLGQEVEGAKDLVIFKLKALCGLKVSNIGAVGRRLGEFLGASLSLELLLTVGILGRGYTRATTRATVVVVVVAVVVGVVRRVGVRLHGICVVRSAVVEV
jgi:hypothetical protein